MATRFLCTVEATAPTNPIHMLHPSSTGPHRPKSEGPGGVSFFGCFLQLRLAFASQETLMSPEMDERLVPFHY